jgi:hypothetical protein
MKSPISPELKRSPHYAKTLELHHHFHSVAGRILGLTIDGKSTEASKAMEAKINRNRGGVVLALNRRRIRFRLGRTMYPIASMRILAGWWVSYASKRFRGFLDMGPHVGRTEFYVVRFIRR